jgi:hypothetical protein
MWQTHLEKQLSHYSVITPQSPLALPHPLSRICICISVVLNSRPCALLPPPLFSLSSLAFVAPSSPPLPLFPLACRVCILIRGGVLSSLPSHAPSLTRTTASLSPAPCSRSRLAPLRSPHRALFAFTTPLVIAFTTVPVFVCYAGP